MEIKYSVEAEKDSACSFLFVGAMKHDEGKQGSHSLLFLFPTYLSFPKQIYFTSFSGYHHTHLHFLLLEHISFAK